MVLVTAGRAHAGPITVHTDLGSFLAEAAPTVREDFSDAYFLQVNSVFQSIAGIADGVYIRPSLGLHSLDNGIYKDTILTGVAYGGPEDAPRFTFGPDIYAFGADWVAGSVTYGVVLHVSLADGTGATLQLASAGLGYDGFFGFTSIVPISAIYLQNDKPFGGASGIQIDNMRISKSVPEPGSLALCLLFIAIGLKRTGVLALRGK